MTESSVSALVIAQIRLQEIWGYPAFRPPQDTVIQALLQHQDALIILPTGGGKSLCFQLPALLQTGLTLVVSPLVALMENQVQELRDRHLPAATLHSELPKREKFRVLKALEHQRLRLLYLSPETLLGSAVWEQLTRADLQINGLVLDEAHCLAQWGETFRPAYRRLGVVRQALEQSKPGHPKIPIAAFTATADPQVQAIIGATLRLRSPQIVRLSPYRHNLHLAVRTVYTPRGRQQQLLKFVQQQRHQTGLVYVRTRRDSEALAHWLRQQGHQALDYHAGLGASERRHREQAWMSNQVRIVVATNAFGMGVNKPDLRWVVHYHVPTLLTEYVQEIGRAGRDGQPAQALSLVSERTGLLDPTDQQRSQFFRQQTQQLQTKAVQLSHKIPPAGSLTDVQKEYKEGAIALSYLHSQGQLQWTDPFHYRLLPTPSAAPCVNATADHVIRKLLHGNGCRWRTIIQQFGFRHARPDWRCGHCDNCQR
ncbi:RecQ family ATP-dependent DNA helicase [Halomicronema sp. CCY15110]|uniref:RecQ family ATP-dependent DNA helicase n=1 Tax=Halomicronema sp. CCY15110 TaxID=2767773 RepID=UPI0035CD3A5D